ncbi:MAG TPA: VOC family protein [Candidatus Saccharimonadales bacterium]|nr:VOC family protein [Candidatus Saccharimonadales bacterium]
MATVLNPYINFDGNTREAMEFYKSVFGGKLDLNTFGEFKAAEDPADADKIMHSQLETPGGWKFMAADITKKFEYKPGSNFSMSLSGEDEAELKSYFEKLGESGTVTMPMEKQMWGDQFGMVNDKFGITWMVNINAAK